MIAITAKGGRAAACYPDAFDWAEFDRPYTEAEDRVLMDLISSPLPARQICAQVVILGEAWGRRVSSITRRIDWLLGPAPVALSLLTATERALMALCGRASEDAKCPGGFRLDGRPAKWTDVLTAANRTLLALGHAPLAVPGDLS